MNMTNVIYIQPTGLFSTDTPKVPLTDVRIESEDPAVIEAFKELVEELRGYPRYYDWQDGKAIIPRRFEDTVTVIDDLTIDLNDGVTNKLADTETEIKYRESESDEWTKIENFSEYSED